MGELAQILAVSGPLIKSALQRRDLNAN